MNALKRSIFFLLVGLFGLAGCGASTSPDNSTGTREVTGSVPSSGSSSVGLGSTKAVTSSQCLADTVVATDTSGTATSTAVNEDCSFSMNLTVGKSYVLSFILEDAFMATLIFDSGIPGFTTSAIPLTEGSSVLDLGSIIISGNVATPSSEPLSQCDQDDDGTPDLSDDDDDNDDINDDDEEDCDLDGFRDDIDDDDSSCVISENEDGTVRVLEVKPRNDPQTDSGDDTVDLDKSVKARVGCVIDQDSVTSETFRVESEEGNPIDCTYDFSDITATTSKVECEHDADPFEPDTVYTATVEGLMCNDGGIIETVSWSWKTENEDDDSGDSEDSLDDEDEEDNSGSDDDDD